MLAAVSFLDTMCSSLPVGRSVVYCLFTYRLYWVDVLVVNAFLSISCCTGYKDMSESSDSEEPSQPKRKRGITNPDTYNRNVIRESRTKGKGYVTYKVHEVKPHEILNFKSWWPAYYKKTVSASDETPGRVIPKKNKNHLKYPLTDKFNFSSHSQGKEVVRAFFDGLR
ncbi:hypothetical protein J6590_069690 [Homalodisca vitripennis]|nr:hypothetical protein J6590_069690 [Homalodisca vitripennis]